jgi:hypothetical protein
MSTAEEALNDLEKRIRHQMEASPQFSPEWLAMMACLAHLEDVRKVVRS